MNDATAGTEVTKAKKKEADVETVVMTDGRPVDFAGKKKMVTDELLLPTGELAIRIDFRNGMTRTFPQRADMKDKFATHGQKQKYQDYLAGAKDDKGNPMSIEDQVLELDALHTQIYVEGDWATKREASGMAGTTVLAQAIAEFKGKEVAAIVESLKALVKKQKDALRLNPNIKAIIDRIEAEKAAKGPAVDTEAILAGIV